LDDEIYRLIITMLKKLKMSKKDDRLVIAEAVSDIYCMVRMMNQIPFKYSLIFNEEEIAKIIFYRTPNALILHDLYVAPKFRKQEIAKILIVESMSDNRDIPFVQFHTRESNKPIHNLTSYFIRKFQLTDAQISTTLTNAFYVDGGKAILYNVANPAYEKIKQMMTEGEGDDKTTGAEGLREDDTPDNTGPQVEVQDSEHAPANETE
jgi:hypothetical protein